MGLWSATALNMIDMIGVGPFITMPLVVSAMGGPQALLGWVAGALLAVCDGLVSAELGAALPASGGSYRYLREMYGPKKWGRLISFLFIWQVSFSRRCRLRRVHRAGGLRGVLLAGAGHGVRAS
jgi:basic amino acid/polyamine antiporter, APA family